MKPATPHWLTAATAAAILPLAPYVNLWGWLVALLLLIWRTGQDFGRLPPLRNWQLIGLTLLACIGIFVTYRSLWGQTAGSSLVVTLAALKLAETRNRRDATLLLYLDYFLALVHFIFSQSLPQALWLLPQLWLTTTALMSLQRGTTLPWREQGRQSARLLLQALPLAALLFVLFPRIEGPLWRLPRDASQGKTGLSDSMSPGNIAALSQSAEVAFRVQFNGAVPPKANRYWRGPVLTRFDGRSWLAGPLPSPPVMPVSGSDAISYTLTQEAHDRRWIFALEALADLPPNSSLNRDYVLQADLPQNELKRYQLKSWRKYQLPESEFDLQTALRLPPGYNPRAWQLAQQWRADSRTPGKVVDHALRYFNQQPFFYTLQPPLLGTHSVDDFLFNSRRGFCEHYASSFVFLMRAAGVPARVVTGYMGGELNPVGGYLIVRQSDAHAWAEVWLGDAGWQRVDPTAAVAPARVQQDLASALPISDSLPLAIRGQPQLLRALRLGWDAIQNRWNQQFLGYDSQNQKSLLQSLGIEELASLRMATLLGCALLLALLPSLAWLWWQHRIPATDPAAAAYQHFCQKLARQGLPRHPAETPTDFAQRAIRQWPQQGDKINAITLLYLQLRYHPTPKPSDLQQMRQQIRTLKLGQSHTATGLRH